MLLENYEHKRKFKDFWAIILFIISVSASLYISYYRKDDGQILDYFKSIKWNYLTILLSFVGYVSAYLIGIFLLYIYTERIMHIAPFGYLIVIACGALYFKNLHFLIIFLPSIILSLITYYFFMRKNIKFSAPIAQLSMKIIKKQTVIIIPTIFLLNCIINFIVINFILTFHSEDFLGYFIIFNFYWSTGLLMYFVYVFISSIVVFNSKITEGYYFAALINTFYALGSLAFGSFIVAIIRTLQVLAASSRDKHGRRTLLSYFAEIILNLIGDIVEYLNSWAYIYISILGLSYISACKRTFEDLYNDPILTFLNNYTFLNALAFIDIAVFITFFLFGYQDLMMIIGIICGVFFTSYIAMAFDSANKTLIVLYSVDKYSFTEAYENESKVFDEQIKSKGN